VDEGEETKVLVTAHKREREKREKRDLHLVVNSMAKSIEK